MRTSEAKRLMYVDDYQDGMSIRQMSKKYGVPYTTMRTTLIRAGIQLRKQGGRGAPKSERR